MRQVWSVVVCVLILGNSLFAQDARMLISESDPAIQGQIRRTYDAFLAAGDDTATNCAAFKEVQQLKDVEDKGEVVKQLAIFAATTESEEDSHVLLTGLMLNLLDLPSSIPIRVLAPYLDADNRRLRDFTQIWFHNHDSQRRIHGRPPLGSVNYYDYMQYVRSTLNRNEEVPIPFIKYLYEDQPGKALLVFAYGSQRAGISDAPTQRRNVVRARREIELSERTISNAIWLKQNDFDESFQKALPEAADELAKLAKHREWWARLYVAEIMRRHREFQQKDILQQLTKDDNALVRKAAESVGE
jgi:hypothetical protein